MRLLGSFLRNESATVALLFGLTLIPVVGATGMAIDYSRASSTRSSVQYALDAAVLAAIVKPNSERGALAQTVYAANIGPGGPSVTPSFSSASDGSFTGTATYTVPNKFGSLLGISSLPVTVSSTAQMTTSSSSSPPPAGPSGACVLLLDTGTQPLLINSGANIQGPNCEIHVKSTASPAAIFNAGTTLNLRRFCIEGANVIQNGGPTPNLALSCPTVADSFAGTLPSPPSYSCNYNNLNYSGSVTLSPGVYCGWFNFNSATNVTFQPGVYVIQGGGWNVNGGQWRGAGVTFHFGDTSKIQFNSNMDIDITAPTTGTYRGILMYECPCLAKTDFIFNNSIANHMEGLIYLPSRNVTFNAQSGIQSDKLTMVFNRLILNAASWNVQPNPDRPLGGGGGGGSPPPPSVTAGTPKLVR